MGARAYLQPLGSGLIVLCLAILGLNLDPDLARGEDGYRLETFATRDGGRIEGAYFPAAGHRVVLLCHGKVFNKESWYDFAEELQEAGIPAFAIDFRGYGNSTAEDLSALQLDVLGAVEHLSGRPGRRIGIVGASMGGHAVLKALSAGAPPAVDRVVILSSGGNPLRSPAMEKLFIASEEEGAFPAVLALFTESSEPKHLQVFPGSRHAQALFGGDFSDEVSELLIQFFRSGN